MSVLSTCTMAPIQESASHDYQNPPPVNELLANAVVHPMLRLGDTAADELADGAERIDGNLIVNLGGIDYGTRPCELV